MGLKWEVNGGEKRRESRLTVSRDEYFVKTEKFSSSDPQMSL